MQVTFHAAARGELAEAVTFYNARTEGLGDALAGEVRATVLQLIAHPEAGYAVRPTVRRCLLRRFPYSLLYNASDQRVRILAVMHHRREPDYWADRL